MDKSLEVNFVERQSYSKFLCKHAMLVFHFQMVFANYLSLRHDFYHVVVVAVAIAVAVVVNNFTNLVKLFNMYSETIWQRAVTLK